MNKILSNERVCLRPVEPEDLALIHKWENDSDIWQISNTQTPFSRFIITQYIESSAEDIYTAKQLRLMIDTNEGETVGSVDLFDFEPFHLRAGIGILIHDRKDRQQGYAQNALNVVANYAAQYLGLKQLYANITVDNPSSISLFEKAGYVCCGTKKQWVRKGNRFFDEAIYQLFL